MKKIELERLTWMSWFVDRLSRFARESIVEILGRGSGRRKVVFFEALILYRSLHSWVIMWYLAGLVSKEFELKTSVGVLC